MRRWVIPMSGRRRAAARTFVDVHERLAHAHEHEMVERLAASEVEHLVEDLPRRQVPAERHAAGRAERAGERAAGLARDAHRAASVLVAHQHRLDGMAVVGVEQRLLRAVLRSVLLDDREGREGHLRRERLAQRLREVRHLLVARGRRARPTPRPGARGRQAGRSRGGSARGARRPCDEGTPRCADGADRHGTRGSPGGRRSRCGLAWLGSRRDRPPVRHRDAAHRRHARRDRVGGGRRRAARRGSVGQRAAGARRGPPRPRGGAVRADGDDGEPDRAQAAHPPRRRPRRARALARPRLRVRGRGRPRRADHARHRLPERPASAATTWSAWRLRAGKAARPAGDRGRPWRTRTTPAAVAAGRSPSWTTVVARARASSTPCAPRRRAAAERRRRAAASPPAEIGSRVDTVTLCLSKGLGCPLGALLAGPAELMELAWREKYPLRRCDAAGGDRRRGRAVRPRPPRRAARGRPRARPALADGLARGGRARCELDRVETNFVQIDVAPLGVDQGRRDRAAARPRASGSRHDPSDRPPRRDAPRRRRRRHRASRSRPSPGAAGAHVQPPDALARRLDAARRRRPGASSACRRSRRACSATASSSGSGCSGSRTSSSREAATPDHVYRIGSITKTFTAVAIMQLRDEGRLELDAPVSADACRSSRPARRSGWPSRTRRASSASRPARSGSR